MIELKILLFILIPFVLWLLYLILRKLWRSFVSPLLTYKTDHLIGKKRVKQGFAFLPIVDAGRLVWLDRYIKIQEHKSRWRSYNYWETIYLIPVDGTYKPTAEETKALYECGVKLEE